MSKKYTVKKDEHEQSIYWRYFTDEQRLALESSPKNDLNGEINILRILMTRFIKREAEGSPSEEGKNQSGLRVKGIASLTLGALQKIQVTESSTNPKWKPILEEAYREAREEMGILDYLSRLEPPENTEDK
jgi:hypothetical protein